MSKKLKQNAALLNPALKPFIKLIGEWKTVGTHPFFPEKEFHGRVSFNWLEGGAFVIMKSEMNEPEIPNSIAIFGSDNSINEYFMLYFDVRGVSRKYDFFWQDNVWKWKRDAPGFSQRFSCTFTDDDKKMIGKGEMSKDRILWEKDLDLIYTRIK